MFEKRKNGVQVTAHNICAVSALHTQNPGVLVMCALIYRNLISMFRRALQGTLAQQTDSLQDMEDRITTLNQELITVSCVY